MSELPDGIEPAPIPEPKDSALGIVVRRGDDGAWDVLLGLRSRRSRFMPGNLAFPGGKLEPEDRPEVAGSLARCASRELFEESGLAITEADWIDAGERTTPPFFHVRFRTRFFVAELPRGVSLPATVPQPEEIETLAFVSPARALADWEAGRTLVPPPLLPIFRAVIGAAPASVASLAAVVAAVNADEQPNPRIEFVPGIWGLPLRTRTLPPASCTNVWMPGGRRFVVIDPGSTESEEQDRLLANVRKREAGGDRVDAVVLSHHHRDHVGGAGELAAALHVPILAHAETLSRLPALRPGVVTRALADGERLDLDGASLTAIHTPGHAPGHLAFLVAPQRALIAGDLVSGLSTILVGFEDGDMDAYLDSLRRAAAQDVAIVLPSHGPPLPVKAIAATLAHRNAREERVIAALGEEPRPLTAIASAAYDDTPNAPPYLREMQARAHLRRLARHGRARQVEAQSESWSL
jgi:glyoxylase-like metal-dependent hydrolase (beta-lactamase superfamily II)/8-oxo-dGTP pyrophosphatase MutT (NUDIX family)